MAVNYVKQCAGCKHKRRIPGDCHIACAKPEGSGVTGKKIGIQNGWFMYPINFDPTWRESDCANYEPRQS